MQAREEGKRPSALGWAHFRADVQAAANWGEDGGSVLLRRHNSACAHRRAVADPEGGLFGVIDSARRRRSPHGRQPVALIELWQMTGKWRPSTRRRRVRRRRRRGQGESSGFQLRSAATRARHHAKAAKELRPNGPVRPRRKRRETVARGCCGARTLVAHPAARDIDGDPRRPTAPSRSLNGRRTRRPNEHPATPFLEPRAAAVALPEERETKRSASYGY